MIPKRMFSFWTEVLLAVGIFACLMGILSLAGCGSQEVRPPEQHPASTLHLDLDRIGSVLLWAGSILAVVGLAFRLAGFFGFLAGAVNPALALVIRIGSPIAPFAVSLGLAAVAVGCGCVWLADHLWILGATVGATAVALVVYHVFIRRDWLVGRTALVSATAIPPQPGK